ncbi:MAG: hypothetical protein HOC21_07065, partial [Phycisphaerae bacterium]|nr:hypothetical protein [Phycisphaerae bacterium]
MTHKNNLFMHGASNRFLVHFGESKQSTLLKELNGADGLLLVEEDAESDAFMRIFNADGSEAEQCGNGLRCVALHLVRSKLIEGSVVTIRTLSGINSCVVREDCNEVEVTLCVPILETYSIESYPELAFIQMGNPNAVLWTEDDPLKVRDEVGELLSRMEQFSNGMNIHIARRD